MGVSPKIRLWGPDSGPAAHLTLCEAIPHEEVHSSSLKTFLSSLGMYLPVIWSWLEAGGGLPHQDYWACSHFLFNKYNFHQKKD